MIRRFSRSAVELCLIAASMMWTVVALSAQVQPPDAFTSMPDSQLGREQLPAAPLVFAGYAFVWLALVAYIFFIWQRLRRAERDVADLTARTTTTRR